MARRKPQKQQQKRYSNNDKQNEKKVEMATVKEAEGESAAVPDASQEPKKNDPAWYAKNEYLLRDVGSYPFGYAYGRPYALTFGLPNTYASKLTQGLASPFSLMSLRCKPTLGFSDKKESPLNVSAASIYGFVRSKNAGRKNYDPADLFLYLTAVANIYSFIVWAERIYAYMMTYSDQNRYIPMTLVEENGVDFDNMLRNLANYRAWLNMFIDKVSVFAVPSDITYFNKVTFMYRNIYIENNDGNIKDQLYQYVPDGFYKFRLDADNIGMLDYVRLPGAMTAADIITFGNDLLANLFEDEDASLISGDLYKVYGDTILRIPALDEFVVMPLTYDPMILWQIKNSTVIAVQSRSQDTAAVTTPGDVRKTGNSEYTLGTGRTQKGIPGSVFQGLDGLLYSVERACDSSATSATTYIATLDDDTTVAMGKVLCSEVAHPEAGIVMESSRNIVGPHKAPLTHTGNDEGWISCGTYIVISVRALRKDENGLNATYTSNHTSHNYHTYVPTLQAEAIATFRYHPLTMVFNADNGVAKNVRYISDLNNFTILGQEQVDKLHDVALLSLFYVPGIAKLYY